MSLFLQLTLGKIGDVLTTVMWVLIILGMIPLVVWLMISIVLWFKKKRKPLKWCLTTLGLLIIYGLIAFGWTRIFCGVPFTIAQRIQVPIPFSVNVLENTQEGGRDEFQEYEVVQFNPHQMDDFIHHIKDWKYGPVSPYSLIRVSPNTVGPDLMANKKLPLPKEKLTGYYLFSITKRYPSSGGWYATRKAYFLNVQTRILYIFYDDTQWG